MNGGSSTVKKDDERLERIAYAHSKEERIWKDDVGFLISYCQSARRLEKITARTVNDLTARLNKALGKDENGFD